MTSPEDACPICQETLEGDEIVITKCQHYFHSTCHIKHLLQQCKDDKCFSTCPMCREVDDKALDVLGDTFDNLSEVKDMKKSVINQVKSTQDVCKGMFSTLKSMYMYEHNFQNREQFARAVNNTIVGFETDIKYNLTQIKETIEDD